MVLVATETCSIFDRSFELLNITDLELNLERVVVLARPQIHKKFIVEGLGGIGRGIPRFSLILGDGLGPGLGL